MSTKKLQDKQSYDKKKIISFLKSTKYVKSEHYGIAVVFISPAGGPSSRKEPTCRLGVNGFGKKGKTLELVLQGLKDAPLLIFETLMI